MPTGQPPRLPVSVAVVGCGTIANVMHLPTIRTLAEAGRARLVAVCDVAPAAARAASDAYGSPPWFTDVDQMLAEQEFDLLVNATRIPDHFGVTMAALRAGRHVYTQKPMTTTVAEATILIEEASRRGLTLACHPDHPVRPMIQTMSRLVRDGAIGKVAFAKVRSSHFGPETHDVPRDSTWFYKPGSDPILDMGVHGLSMITAILGPVRRLACFSGRTANKRVHTAGAFKGKEIAVEIDDNSQLLLDFGDATFCQLDATYCVADSLSPRIEIFGSKGVLALTGADPKWRLQRYDAGPGRWEDITLAPPPPVRDAGTPHTIDHLVDGAPLVLTPERGRHLVEIMTRAPEAAALGRTLELETTF